MLGLLLAKAPVLAQGIDLERTAEAMARQPAKDVGLLREEAAPLLLEAKKAPYSLKGLKNCSQLSAAIAELDAVLGPDLDALEADSGALTTRLAKEGGTSLVASLIPFRGLVREVTGAADADRKLRAAVTTGIARRAFLKGVAAGRGCKPTG